MAPGGQRDPVGCRPIQVDEPVAILEGKRRFAEEKNVVPLDGAGERAHRTPVIGDVGRLGAHHEEGEPHRLGRPVGGHVAFLLVVAEAGRRRRSDDGGGTGLDVRILLEENLDRTLGFRGRLVRGFRAGGELLHPRNHGLDHVGREAGLPEFVENVGLHLEARRGGANLLEDSPRRHARHHHADDIDVRERCRVALREGCGDGRGGQQEEGEEQECAPPSDQSPPPISATIASAAEAGSSASVIGLPMTM